MGDNTIDVKRSVEEWKKEQQKEKPVHLEDRISMLEKQMGDRINNETKKEVNIMKHSEIEDWIQTFRKRDEELTKIIFRIENDNLNRDKELNNLVIKVGNGLVTLPNSHDSLIERLSKRLESTEAQIRKLFALIDTIKPKDEQTDADNRSKRLIDINNREQDRITVKSNINTLYIQCEQCAANNHYSIKESIRRVRMSSGHITDISYEWKCKCCKLPMIVTL